MIDFLSAPWWAGVQGVVALIALAVGLVAIVDFALRLNRESVNATNFSTEKQHRVEPDGTELVDFTIRVRPMATTVLHEAQWRFFGNVMANRIQRFPPVIGASDNEVEVMVTAPLDSLGSAYVAVEWLAPRRLGSRLLSARLRLDDLSYQWWEPYLWIWWPRKVHGRWKTNPRRKRTRLAPPPH